MCDGPLGRVRAGLYDGRVTTAPTRPDSADATTKRRLVDRLPLPSEAALRRLAGVSLVTQAGIIVTGGAVRLTDSGLGCPDWPHCTSGRLTPTTAMGVHGAIEFGNRTLTFVLGIVAFVTLLAVVRTFSSDRPRRDLLALSWILLGFIPAQAVIGGITVWTDLNPWVVMFHFLVSAALVAVATVFFRRAQHPAGVERQRLGNVWLERFGLVVLALTAVTVYLGTVVTGSGPHSGDPDSKRTGLDLAVVTQLHADAVFVLVGASIGFYFAARALGSPGRVTRAAGMLLVVEVAQGLVGVVQYRLELPELLVGLHMLGAAAMIVAATDAWLASRWQPAPAPASRLS